MTPMTTLTSRLLAGFSSLVLLAAVGLFASRPAHTAGGPVPVTISNTIRTQDVDNAARQPFQIEIPFVSNSANSSSSFPVPSGKQLVLENISALTYTPSDPVVEVVVSTTVGEQTVRQDVGFASTLSKGFRVMPVVPVRLYADGGSTVTVTTVRNTSIPSYSGYGNVVKLSGYLVNIP